MQMASAMAWTMACAMACAMVCAIVGCTPPAPTVEQTVAPSAAACQKTGQQCRLGGTNALGVCYKDGPQGGWSCTPQH